MADLHDPFLDSPAQGRILTALTPKDLLDHNRDIDDVHMVVVDVPPQLVGQAPVALIGMHHGRDDILLSANDTNGAAVCFREEIPGVFISAALVEVPGVYIEDQLPENLRVGTQTTVRYDPLIQHVVQHAFVTAVRLLEMDIQMASLQYNSAVKLYTVLNLLFKMAYLADTIERNPMDKVERPKARKDEKLKTGVEAFTVDELRYIFKCLDGEPLKWRALVRLMVDTGIRRGECCGLTWENVDFVNNQITIAQSLNYTKDAGVFVSMPKNGKRRVIDVGEEVMELLRQLRREQADIAISKYVFTQDGTADAMFPQSPEHYMRMFSRRYGVQHMHPHKLRQSFASIAITNGADVVSVSEILGHADTAITLRTYAHASEESRKKASNIFREALGNA